MIQTSDYSFLRNQKGRWLLNVPEGTHDPEKAEVIVTEEKALLLRDDDFLILEDLPKKTLVRLAGDVATGLSSVTVAENGETEVKRTYRAALYFS